MLVYHFRPSPTHELVKLPKFKSGCWVEVTEPTATELSELHQTLKLDQGHLRDALDPYEVPRVETEGDFLYIFIRVPTALGQGTITKPLLLVIAPTFFATVTSSDHSIMEKIKLHPELFTSQKAKMFELFLQAVFTHYHTMVIMISKQVNESLTKVNRISNREVVSLITFESYINEMLSSIIPLHEALNTVLTGRMIQFFKDDREYVEDLYLSSGQLITLAKNQLNFIRNTRDSYSTVMTNNLNKVIKLFTSLTVILTVPTIISSFYGMNVRLPGSDHPLTFVGILAVTISAVFALVWYFDYNDWL